MANKKPAIITNSDLSIFVAKNRFDGDVMFARDLGKVLPGQRAKFVNEKQLRRIAGGDRVDGKVINGPCNEEQVEKISKSKPFAILYA